MRTCWKTESAIRLTHIPTNIVVFCQNDRSQHRNRAQAWQMLRAKLYESELKKREEKAAAARSVERESVPGLASGRIRVPVEQVFALEEVAQAYERFAASGKFGKIVLSMTAH